MQKTLKAKIQNVLSLTSSNDVDSPALFVGGRRRNRKKRKTKNGPGKRKVRKGGATETPSRVVTPSTPDSPFEELLPIYSVKRPVVSCLDIRQPVFYEPVTSLTSGTEEEHDSVYNSNASLPSLSSGQGSDIEHDDITETADDLVTEDVLEEKKVGFSRTNSEDSGMYDEDSVEDAGYGGEMVDEIADELEEQITDDAFENNITSDERFDEVFKDDDQVINCAEVSTIYEEKTLDEFDEIDLDDDQETVEQGIEIVEKTENDDADETAEEELVVFDSIREMETIPEAISFANFVQPADEDEIIFDLSQLEVNNTQGEFSKIPKSKGVIKLSEVLDAPTDLEEGVSFKVPMDLLIDDDDENEEVLFEATKKKDLCITCNPLYEHVLREEEDSLSIKSYQSGFKTDFDNINLIQIPTVASSKSSAKPLKESSPLIKRQQAGGDGDNELACCIIL